MRHTKNSLARLGLGAHVISLKDRIGRLKKDVGSVSANSPEELWLSRHLVVTELERIQSLLSKIDIKAGDLDEMIALFDEANEIFLSLNKGKMRCTKDDLARLGLDSHVKNLKNRVERLEMRISSVSADLPKEFWLGRRLIVTQLERAQSLLGKINIKAGDLDKMIALFNDANEAFLGVNKDAELFCSSVTAKR